MANKKIVFLGAGSLYFVRRTTHLLLSEQLAGSRIVFYDIDGRKAEMVRELYRRLASQVGTRWEMVATTDRAEALDGADFALGSIGGSGAAPGPRVYVSPCHRADVEIPARYGIHQVVGDTCGPAGMMMGLRSVPIYLEICRQMERRCPEAILLNHSNPMAVLCRAMSKYSDITVYGICHGVQAGIRHVAGLLEADPHELDCTWIGTNHYYWFTRLLHRGEDVYGRAMRKVRENPDEPGCRLTRRLSLAYRHLLVYPSDSHTIEFYPWARGTDSPEELPCGLGEEARRRMEEARGGRKQSGRGFQLHRMPNGCLPPEGAGERRAQGPGALQVHGLVVSSATVSSSRRSRCRATCAAPRRRRASAPLRRPAAGRRDG